MHLPTPVAAARYLSLPTEVRLAAFADERGVWQDDRTIWISGPARAEMSELEADGRRRRAVLGGGSSGRPLPHGTAPAPGAHVGTGSDV